MKEKRFIIAVYSVQDATVPTKLINLPFGINNVIIDGVEHPSVDKSFTFDTVGEHQVEFELINDSIVEWTFEECENLKSITIPEGVTTIGEGAFENCSGLTSVAIPDSVTSIGQNAFYGCSRLTDIKAPNGVKFVKKVCVDYNICFE